LDPLPALTGTKPSIYSAKSALVYNTANAGATETATTSCYQCIRGGFVWCSNLWHYEEDVANSAYTTSTEYGMCCFDKTDLATKEADNAYAYADNCKARFTNVAGASITENSAGSWWCSYVTDEPADTYIRYEEL